MVRLTWAQPEDLVAHEFVALRHEGADPSPLEEEWAALGGSLVPQVSGASPTPASPEVRRLARDLLERAQRITSPARTEGIDLFPGPGRPEAPAPLPANFAHALEGAWYGRLAGCVLGKPVEKIPRAGIREIAEATDRWPIDRYFTAVGLPDDVARRWPWNRRSAPTSLEENIDGMPEDDDVNYPLLALRLLEERGRDFTSDDVVQLWLDNLPAGRVFTAERAAYRNILEARPVPETASWINPFREWIGALIRGDVFGWVNPGRPWAAAEMAWRDARVSHTRNGLYGEMWAAALCASAMVSDSAEDALDRSLTVIPEDSQLARAVRFGIDTARRAPDREAGLDALHAEYGHLHWVHVLNNAATIAHSLVAARGDWSAAVCTAVTAGWDTDSVGATVGSVMGALVGRDGIPSRWTDPIGTRLHTSLPRFDGISSDTVIERLLTIARTNNDA